MYWFLVQYNISAHCSPQSHTVPHYTTIYYCYSNVFILVILKDDTFHFKS